jgi:methyl halide transferase
MSTMTEVRTSQVPDWDAMYRLGTPPWESGVPSGELIRVLEQRIIPPGVALELGCGSGADAVCLAQWGFEVTAVDSSPTALERARVRARREQALVHFVLDDVFEFGRTAEPFDLIYDAGFYHFIRQEDLNQLLDLLWRLTRPGSYYLALVGSSQERAAGGPPGVSKGEIHDELGRLFDFVHMRPFRFESPRRPKGYRGWSCLMRRPELPD